MTITAIGALCFGIVVGWVTYRTLRRSPTSGLSDIATVIGAVGGGAITALFKQETDAFGWYCIGLLVGFFVYLILAVWTSGRQTAGDWLGSEPNPPGRGGSTPLPPK